MNRLLIILAVILILIILIFCKITKAEVYKITWYCACKKCCGKNAKGITAIGLPVKSGMIAVDKSIIPLGTIVIINGLGTYLAADTGSKIKGNRIDVFIKNHKLALKNGVQYREVEICHTKKQ